MCVYVWDLCIYIYFVSTSQLTQSFEGSDSDNCLSGVSPYHSWILLHFIFFFFFFKDFILFFFLFLPKVPWYIVVYSSLWVLPAVACGTPPQHGRMSSAMFAPRIRTNETLGRLQQSARTQPLGHGASPQFIFFLGIELTWLLTPLKAHLQIPENLCLYIFV